MKARRRQGGGGEEERYGCDFSQCPNLTLMPWEIREHELHVRISPSSSQRNCPTFDHYLRKAIGVLSEPTDVGDRHRQLAVPRYMWGSGWATSTVHHISTLFAFSLF